MAIIFDHVYEDPRLELMLCQKYAAKKVLFIASGGCTALTLKTRLPELQVSVVDTNADQLSLVKEKVALLESRNYDAIKQKFDIAKTHNESFSRNAVFNGINRCLRLLTNELLIHEDALKSLFSERPYSIEKAKSLFHNQYWDLIFDMVYGTSLVSVKLSSHVNHPLIRDRIGKFLCKNIRLGLCSPCASDNYILQKLFLGYYLPEVLPAFLQSPCKNPYNFQYFHTSLEEVPDLDTYDVISLSNICSWMNLEQMKNFMCILASRLKIGAVILLRETSALRDPQKNPIEANDFLPGFSIDQSQGETLLALESSMLFDKIYVGIRV